VFGERFLGILKRFAVLHWHFIFSDLQFNIGISRYHVQIISVTISCQIYLWENFLCLYIVRTTKSYDVSEYGSISVFREKERTTDSSSPNALYLILCALFFHAFIYSCDISLSVVNFLFLLSNGTRFYTHCQGIFLYHRVGKLSFYLKKLTEQASETSCIFYPGNRQCWRRKYVEPRHLVRSIV